jgi:hypothetical protein
MKPELFELIDSLRSSPRGLEASALIREMEKHGLAITEEDMREIVNRRDGGGFIPPKRVVEFVIRLASGRKISSALDFGCGVVGFIGKALEQQKATVTALTQVSECAALSQFLCKDTNVDVACANPLAWLEQTKLRFDFVFGLPPWGFKSALPLSLPAQGASVAKRIDAVIASIAWVGSRLTDDGLGVFVVPDSFAWNQVSRPIETLGECGLHLVLT